MSWQAVDRALRRGPADDALARVVARVLWAADPEGHDARCGLRTVAAECNKTLHQARRLLEVAVSDGWLVLEDRGDGRRPAAYAMGPRLEFARGIPRAERGSSAQTRALARGSSAQSRAPKEKTLKTPAQRAFWPAAVPAEDNPPLAIASDAPSWVAERLQRMKGAG